MNEAGETFCKRQSARYGRAVAITKSNAVFTQPRIVERVMRLGVEAAAFKPDLPLPHSPFEVTEDLERLAVATIKRDFADHAGIPKVI
jgi:hypothetical protein